MKEYFETVKAFCVNLVGDTGVPWWAIPVGAAFIIAVIF